MPMPRCFCIMAMNFSSSNAIRSCGIPCRMGYQGGRGGSLRGARHTNHATPSRQPLRHALPNARTRTEQCAERAPHLHRGIHSLNERARLVAGPTPATSAPGPGLTPCHICTGTGLAHTTSAPGLGAPGRRRRRRPRRPHATSSRAGRRSCRRGACRAAPAGANPPRLPTLVHEVRRKRFSARRALADGAAERAANEPCGIGTGRAK